MKRRDFLIGATSSTSLMYLKSVRAAVPCPPILSGAPAVSCSTIDAEQDWQSRISGPGVVWYHNFESEAEVSRFRWYDGINDMDNVGDGTCRHIATDGVTGGGCLEIAIPTGGTAGSTWIRPFSPLTGATNGRGVTKHYNCVSLSTLQVCRGLLETLPDCGYTSQYLLHDLLR